MLTAVDSFKPINPTRRLRVLTILGLALVWFVIAKSISASAVSTVFTSLTLMLYLLVPWTAANLVDFFFVRRGHYAITDLFKLDGIYGEWGRRGLIAYGAGFLLEIPFMILPDLGGWSYTGFMAKALDNVDIAWIVGLIVSGGVYWFLTRSLDVEREKRPRRPPRASWCGAVRAQVLERVGALAPPTWSCRSRSATRSGCG